MVKDIQLLTGTILALACVLIILLLPGCNMYSVHPKQVLDNAYRVQESLVEISIKASQYLDAYIESKIDRKKLNNMAVILEDQLDYQINILDKGIAGEYTGPLKELGNLVKELIDYLKGFTGGREYREEELERLLENIVQQNNSISDMLEKGIE